MTLPIEVENRNPVRYKDFSSWMFRNHILPVIESIPAKPQIQEMVHRYSFAALEPGRRFFPSSLSLITARAIIPDEEIVDFTKPEFIYPSAAVELFHNSTLLHDDVIDKHTFRRNAVTVYAEHGEAASLLAGNYAVGEAMWLLANSHSPYLHKLLDLFAGAAANVNYGQLLDEKHVWDNVHPEDRMAHWHTVSEQKTIAGLLACMVGTTIVGKLKDVSQWYEFEKNLGIMSQIINDVGDVWSFTGYLETEASRRVGNEESDIKYTYPRLWYFGKTGHELNGQAEPLRRLTEEGFIEYAHGYVEILRKRSHEILKDLSIAPGLYKELLIDFVNSPRLPELSL